MAGLGATSAAAAARRAAAGGQVDELPPTRLAPLRGAHGGLGAHGGAARGRLGTAGLWRHQGAMERSERPGVGGDGGR